MRWSPFFVLSLWLILARCAPNSFIDRQSICKKVHSLNGKARSFLPTLPDSAFHIANRALQLSDDSECAAGQAESHQILGMVLFHQGVYQESFRHLLQAESVYQRLGDLEKNAECLNQLGLVYYNIKQPERALDQHRKALSYYENLKDEKGIAYSYGCIGHLFEKKNAYQEALEYQQKALMYYQKSHDIEGTATILENIGSIYEDLGDYALALDYFVRSLKFDEQTGDSLAMIVNINNIGDNYRKTNQYQKAIDWTRKAANLAYRLKDKYQLSSAYKDLSKSYSLLGDYENAYKTLEIGRNLYQEMYAQDASRQLILFETLFEIERKNHAIEVLEADQKFSTAIKITLTSLLTLLVLLGGVVISRQRLKIRRNKEVIQQNNQIYETSRKLMQAEIENTRLHEQKLQHELESKAKSLTSHTLHIISKNKMLEDIQLKLTELLKEGPNDHRKQLKSLVKMIEHNFVQDKDWDDFRKIFEQVHQDFFQRLQLKALDLTSGDIRLAALLKLKIPSKDIAVVLGISPDSLRIARYRLRKKLNLGLKESLSNFLSSL